MTEAEEEPQGWECPDCTNPNRPTPGTTHPSQQWYHVTWTPSWEPRDYLDQYHKPLVDEYHTRNARALAAVPRIDTRSVDEKQGQYHPNHNTTYAQTIGEAIRKRITTCARPINPHVDIHPTGHIELITREVEEWSDGTRNTSDYTLIMNPDGTLKGKLRPEAATKLMQEYYSQWGNSHVHDGSGISTADTPDNQPPIRKADFAIALAKLLTRYNGEKTSIQNHWRTPPNIYAALKTYLGVDKERFASPLNHYFEHYWSAHPDDTDFGAQHDTYSCRWTGLSVANPEYEHADMDKAVHWALASAANTTDATATIFILPAWSQSSHTTYLRWQQEHPEHVKLLMRVPKNCFKFLTPDAWRDNHTTAGHPKWDVNFLVVANSEGMTEVLTKAALHKDNLLRDIRDALHAIGAAGPRVNPQSWWQLPRIATNNRARQITNQLHSSTNNRSPPRGTAKFRRLPWDTNMMNSRPPSTHGSAPNIDITSTFTVRSEFPDVPPLRYNWQDFAYTDGSDLRTNYKQDGNDVVRINRIGAAVYIPPQMRQKLRGTDGQLPKEHIHAVDNGPPTTQTINRAELAAIYLAIKAGCTSILTDSSCCIWQIHSMSLAPQAFLEHRHQDLVTAIIELIDKADTPVTIYKVKSHTGVVGNEIVDTEARRVAGTAVDDTPSDWNHDIPLSNHRSKMYWIYSKPPFACGGIKGASDTDAEHTYELEDLTTSLKRIAHTTHRLGTANTKTVYFNAWQTITPQLNLAYSHKFLTSPGMVKFGVRTQMLRCRTGTLLNMKNARKYGWTTDATCPLCRQAEDSVGHILGACTAFKRLYIERHNATGREILKAIRKGRFGGTVKQADIGVDRQGDNTEEDIHSTETQEEKDEEEMLQEPYICRDLNQADIWGAIEPHTFTSRPDITLLLPASGSEQPKQTLVMVELKYCRDTQPDSQYKNAGKQHEDIVRAVQTTHGHLWEVKLVRILVGATGAIYREHTSDALEALGIKGQSLKDTLTTLHKTAINFAASIIYNRRKMEKTQGVQYKLQQQEVHKHTTIPTRQGPNRQTMPRCCQHTTGVT